MSEKWNKIGALWSKESPTGKSYWTGEVTVAGVKKRISVWQNTLGGGENKPHMVIYDGDQKRG